MNRRGLTVAELIIALVLIGALVAITVPRIGQAMTKQGMRSARNAVIGMVAKSKASAVQRGTATSLQLSGGDLVIRSRHPVTGAVDTVGHVENMYQRFGAYVSASSDSLVFDPRGIGATTGSTTIIVTRGSYADTILISRAGRVLR